MTPDEEGEVVPGAGGDGGGGGGFRVDVCAAIRMTT